LLAVPTMNNFGLSVLIVEPRRLMKIFPIILLVALIGCSRSKTPSQASQMSQQIQSWVPKGTSVSKVRQIMEQHQFAYTVGSYDSKAAMPPGSDPLWWDVGSFISANGRTLRVTNVTLLTCTRTDTNNDVWTYDATFTGVDGEFDGSYLVSARHVR
jgi:hypothetical protein